MSVEIWSLSYNLSFKCQFLSLCMWKSSWSLVWDWIFCPITKKDDRFSPSFLSSCLFMDVVNPPHWKILIVNPSLNIGSLNLFLGIKKLLRTSKRKLVNFQINPSWGNVADLPQIEGTLFIFTKSILNKILLYIALSILHFDYGAISDKSIALFTYFFLHWTHHFLILFI